jgi:O-antigen/teichoic acid export membrane protein
MATLSANPERTLALPNLIRTLEWIFWGIAIALGCLLLGLSSCVATHWLCPENLPVSTVTRCVSYMAIALLFYWPSSLYSMSLLGLQKQVACNVVLIICGTLRACGILLLFALVEPSIELFFLWQILISLLQTGIQRVLLWRQLPKIGEKPRFDRRSLASIKSFALGISAVSVTGILLTNLDKVILSKMLPLGEFGLYSLVTQIALSVTFLCIPLHLSHFPHLAQLVSMNNWSALKSFYHKSSQKLALLILPLSLTIIFFPKSILSIVLGNRPYASSLPLFLSLYMVGSLCNALTTMPYTLQMAIGWTRLALYQNLLSIGLLSSSLAFAVAHFGLLGAALLWLLLNAGALLFTVPIMHRRVLQNEAKTWYLKDNGLPLCGALVGILSAHALLPASEGVWEALLTISFAFCLSLCCCGLYPKLWKWTRA